MTNAAVTAKVGGAVRASGEVMLPPHLQSTAAANAAPPDIIVASRETNARRGTNA